MWFDSPMLYVIALLAGAWIAVSREARVALQGYVVQTIAVGVLYLVTAIKTADPMIWLALVGLIALRILFIPWLLQRSLPRELYLQRQSRELVSPAYGLVLYVILSAIGLGVGRRLGHGLLGTDFGIALAVLLIGFAIVAIAHHTPKQIMGILAADNGADLAVVLTLTRVSVVADYAVFIDVAVAVVCLAFLVIRLRMYGTSHAHDLHELRG
ncbi:hypothetical protein [Alicyclobacillus mengziensis]|uniref:Hydrogenase-4 component E n=1 Tax=Alicyclobacillus mengziensis TaxID=2931921 RepID=A0A9X7Z6C6_9BACL|nr:hypothetical protein [Alicyclobacillus mengziensis]QSO47222.1 hypothetical protein JZ786_22975 [Alicyclobacillus mengziensis]